MKRPLLLATVCFTLGCLLALWGPLPGAMGLLGAGMTLVAALLLRTARARQTLWIAAVFVAAGASLTLFRSVAPTPQLPEPYWKTGEIHGRVLEAPVFWPGIDYAQLLVETEQGTALVRWSDPPAPVFPGQRVSLQGDATTLIGNVNFGLSGPEDYYRILGVTHAVAVSGRALQVTDTPEYSLAYWIGRMRAWQGELLSRSCPKETLPFLFAVWLGQRDRIDHASSQDYVDTGTAHMLSVSGLHVAIIYFSLEFLLSAFIKRERLRAVVILIAVFAFAFMAGARPSTLRAAIVIAMYLSARFVRREPDAPTALAVSALMLLLWNPRLLLDVGAILSFASVASLLCYAEPFTLFLQRRLHLPERLVSPLAACLAVQVLTLPLTAIWFHTLSYSSPLANLIAVPLLDAVLWGCVLIVAIGATLPPVALLFGHAVWPAVAAIEGWVDFLAGFDMLSQLLPPPTTPALCCYYVAVLLPLILGGAPAQTEPVASAVTTPARRRLIIASTACLLFASILFWWPPQPRGQVDVLDVGHGDAAVIFPPEGGAVLIDAGDRSEYRDYGDSVVAPFLLAHGITHLDAIISTHPDRDHIGGIFTVLRELSVGKVLLSKLPSGKPLEAGVVTACRERGIPVERIGAGDLLEIGGARLEILHPPPHGWSSPSVNNTSVVARLSWTESDGTPFRMLFPGDIEEPAEVLIAQQDCHADILRVPHHGSFTSSTDAFLDAVTPRMAIVSTRTTARRNAMGPGVEERYATHEIPLYRTDTHGGLRIKGFPATLTSAREQRGYLPQSVSSTVAPVH